MLGAVFILLGIWTTALMCSVPLFIYRKLHQFNIAIPVLNINKIYYCVEDWPELPFLSGRVYYSLFSLAIQYFIPILVVSSAYLRIYFRLKKRILVSQNISSVDDRIKQRRGQRTKRTNYLLVSIALIFGVSWLPLNFYNLYMDLFYSANDTKLTQTTYIIYAACHMAGMSSGKLMLVCPACGCVTSIFISYLSACSNPLLYGWLNSNFRKEFNEILCCKKNGIDSFMASQKQRGAESSVVMRKRSYMHQQNGSDKPKTELLKPNNNEEVQEFTL
jgi:neuropeptide Y receptor